MLITVPDKAKTPTVERLIQIWAQRYVPDLSSINPQDNTAEFRQALFRKASLAGRVETASKITKRVVAIKCQMASLQAKSLYAYFPTAITFSDTQRLSEFALLIYLKIAEIYQQPSQSPTNKAKLEAAFSPESEVRGMAFLENFLSIEDWGMPAVEDLATELEPLLLAFQQQHILSEDKRTLGFLTTLLNFCNDLILKSMPAVEKLLIYPYFKFVEEQVALPWQRVCLAASCHSFDSLAFTAVETCLPQAQTVAERTYQQLTEMLPHHYSRRGLISNAEIAHSTLRDLQMNQAYFWLSVLEGTLSSVEEELIPLCTMVFPAIGVSWKLIALSNQVLFDELLSVMDLAQADYIRPLAHDYIRAFNQRQPDFQAVPEGLKAEAQAKSINPLEQLGQLQSQLLASGSPTRATATQHQAPQAANASLQAADIERLKAKMALLEAELQSTHRQLNTLLPRQDA